MSNDMLNKNHHSNNNKRLKSKIFNDENQLKNCEGSLPKQKIRKRESIKKRGEITDASNARQVHFGKEILDTWYDSPYPENVVSAPKFFVCEKCFKYTISETSMKRHHEKCALKFPPGRLMYHDSGKFTKVFEIDGAIQRLFCQNLCLFCRLFLSEKTLSFDVDEFLFYVLVVRGRIVGYFSKEKSDAKEQNNLACILTLPQYQKLGYGMLLISLSYLLSKCESRVGNPEKPLSKFGLIAYRSFWKYAILKTIFLGQKTCPTNLSKFLARRKISIEDIANKWAINPQDILDTLQHYGMLQGNSEIVISEPDAHKYFDRLDRDTFVNRSFLL